MEKLRTKLVNAMLRHDGLVAVPESWQTEYVKLAKKDGKIANAILSNSHIQNIQYKNWFWLDKNVEILKLEFTRNN